MERCPRCDAPIRQREATALVCEREHRIDVLPLGSAAAAERKEGEQGGRAAALPVPTAAPFAAGAPKPGPERVVTVRCAASIAPAEVTWLWPGRIPFGKMTVIDGDPGLGKSLLSLDIAARLSSGRPMPGEETAACPAGNVLLLSNEDDASDTVVPRLMAAGADRNRVHIVEHVTDLSSGDELPLSIPTHTGPLARATQQYRARLVVLDPLMAYLDGTVNTSRDHAVRQALNPIKDLAQRTGCAVLFVRHLNKAEGMSALHRGGGSVAFGAIARSTLVVAPDPVDPARRVLAPNKSNLAGRVEALVYRVSGEPPSLTWHGSVNITADALLGAGGGAQAEQTETARAMAWLREQLGGGPRGARALCQAAEAAGFARNTLFRARQALGVAAFREGFGREGRWYWGEAVGSLP